MTILVPVRDMVKMSYFLKIISRIQRMPEEHKFREYLCSSCDTHVFDDHSCYLTATRYKQNDSKFIFFDFECSHDYVLEYQEGYRPVV